MAGVPKVTAIVGTYRKGGVIDKATDEILASARKHGAVTEKIYLIDHYIRYCTNCRSCTQNPGRDRGACILQDDAGGILDRLEASDAVIFASPMNFGTVTAVMKTFIERFVCYAWWPWGAPGPKMRNKKMTKRAVIVASSAAPAILAAFSSKMTGLMESVAKLLGAKTVGTMFIGFAAMKPDRRLTRLEIFKARRLGKKLAG